MKNEITYVNKEVVVKNGKEQMSFKELMNFHKGNIAAVITFLATNRAAVFLGGVGQDQVIYWLGEQAGKYPELAGAINVAKNIVSISWNALVANPNLCAIIVSGLVACGATAIWGIKKIKLNHDIKKGNIVVDNSLKK